MASGGYRWAAGLPLPIVAQLACDRDALTLGKTPVGCAAWKLQDAGADVVGANCGVGPRPMLRTFLCLWIPLLTSFNFMTGELL